MPLETQVPVFGQTGTCTCLQESLAMTEPNLRPDPEPGDQGDAVRRQVAAYAAEIRLHGRAIAARGTDTYGAEWDPMVDRVAKAIAARAGCSIEDAQTRLTEATRGFDDPIEIIRTMSEDPERLQKMLSMPAYALSAEMGRIEAQNSPHGRRIGAGSGRPAWMTSDHEGRTSDSDWNRYGGNHLDDAAWSKEFDRRAEQRFGIAPGRFHAGRMK
jgi:hypothetical protein